MPTSLSDNSQPKNKKRKVDPLDEGCLRLLYEWFFAPLIHYKPESMTLETWMDTLFHEDTRTITRYEVVRPFIMPGLYYAAAQVKIQGIGYRKVAMGAFLEVVEDSTLTTFDVEILSGQGEKDNVFNLDSTQWGEIKLSCIKCEKKNAYEA